MSNEQNEIALYKEMPMLFGWGGYFDRCLARRWMARIHL